MVQKSKLNFKKVISGAKLSLWLIWCWPMPKNATRFKTICMKLYHDLCIILALGLEASLIYAAANHIDDFALFIELFVQQAPVVHAICNIIFHKINYRRIQNITFEMEHFCESMKSREEIVIQRYIDKCIGFYTVSTVVFYLVTVAAIILPPLVHQPFPTLAEYPFDVFNEPLRTTIYVYESIVAFIASAQLCLNGFAALLLWFASAKFEMLIEELRTFTNVCHLVKCIKKHQEILGYITEVITVSRFFALTCICCSTVNLIIVGVSFLINQSLMLRFKYIFMVLACLGEVFMFAWPAEHLILLSNDMHQAAYDTHWYNQSVEVRKLLQIIIARSQKVITIAIPCITPSISFNYLTSYCATIMSYFTTLRVMLSQN